MIQLFPLSSTAIEVLSSAAFVCLDISGHLEHLLINASMSWCLSVHNYSIRTQSSIDKCSWILYHDGLNKTKWIWMVLTLTILVHSITSERISEYCFEMLAEFCSALQSGSYVVHMTWFSRSSEVKMWLTKTIFVYKMLSKLLVSICWNSWCTLEVNHACLFQWHWIQLGGGSQGCGVV